MKKFNIKAPAILILEDGTVFKGKAAGKIGTSSGEICFNTGMTGYQEIFTDPSYFGQILVMTFPHIGNYGVSYEEKESDEIKIAGLVCKKLSEQFSRKSAYSGLQEYLEQNNTVAITDVDTRALVRHIRNKGAMNAIISSETTDINKLKKIFNKIPSMEGLELSSKVSTKQNYLFGNRNAKYKIALIDLGTKKNILNSLSKRNCLIKVFSMHSKLKEILEWEPDGIVISNGPGDPAAMPETVRLTQNILKTNIPVFGICLGHQIISSALGLSTYKMYNGHRGINHPVKNLLTGKGEITSQNHGFVVSLKDAEKNPNIIITHQHLNDKTLAGIKHKSKNIFSVQFHPEASPGPHDSEYLFDNFILAIQNHKHKKFINL